ncbi:hypothetical protein LTR37_009089 [Vermiconidia calcicola]|uniref:Uncharacterized protein n=1 Tax=Vermiconidia calcicola TaxID=1690605 RepID=A0ACC3NA47_9PEZI|nr:hypothetical protein LTR37_009089 [Vermiconidia calcicola]
MQSSGDSIQRTISNDATSYSYWTGVTAQTDCSPKHIAYSYQSSQIAGASLARGPPAKDQNAFFPNALATKFEPHHTLGQTPQSSQHVHVTGTRNTSHGATVPQAYNTLGTIVSGLRETPEHEPTSEGLRTGFTRSVKPRKFFVEGKVFLTLWAEPAGTSASGAASAYTKITGSGISTGRFGEHVYSKIRRFVVVREGDRSCTAIPIVTYSGQGVAKQSLKKDEHTVVYTGKKVPSPTPQEMPKRGEAGMLPQAVRVDPDDLAEKLDDMSRIHFAKVYTIEHNVKVKSFGRVNRNSMQPLLYQFRTVWERTAKGGRPIDTKQKSQRDVMPEEAASAITADLARAYDILIANGYSEERARAVLSGGTRSHQEQPDSASGQHNDDLVNEH